MYKIKPIILPSFLRRSLKAYALKTVIRATDSELSRIGRSRNWRLIASQQQLQKIIIAIENSNEVSWLWLIKLLKENKAQISHHELLHLIKLNPDISINELLTLSDCTIAQARKALDEMEGFN